jgi:hypothetical protein
MPRIETLPAVNIARAIMPSNLFGKSCRLVQSAGCSIVRQSLLNHN